MAFEQQINNFVNYGMYSYQFDEAGNLILNASSSVFQQRYFSMELINFDYDTTKILSFYDPSFQEFIKPVATSSVTVPFELQEYIDNISKENEGLRQQLDNIIASADLESKAQSDEQQIKDIILQLRIALNQGRTLEDFYTTFPYLPLTDSDRSSGEKTIEEMLPNSPQMLPPAPGIDFSATTTRLVQVTGSEFRNVADTTAVIVSNATGSSKLSVGGLSPSNIVTVNRVQPSFTNVFSRGLTQYNVYDPIKKTNVWVVKDLSTGHYVDRATGTFYRLPLQYL